MATYTKDWACPRCARQPNEPCRDDDGVEMAYFHAERVEVASEGQGRSETVPLTEDLIEGTGLV